MGIGRTILAILIALSVAILPAAAAAAVSSQSPAPAGMSMTDDMDCCPHKANPCEKAMEDCAAMATCVLKCFSFTGTSSSTIVFPSTSAKMTATFAGNPFSSQAGSPPFRPPRV
jgi:hypothetical protein